MNCSLDNNLSIRSDSDNSANLSSSGSFVSCWQYWTDLYYPEVIRFSYPMYIQERAQDNGKKAYEIIKILKDKKLAKLNTVSDFINLMDELIKIL